MIKKVIVGTEELNLTTNGETRKSLLIIKPSAATCACRGASHILTDGEAGDTIIINFSITKECKWQRQESNLLEKQISTKLNYLTQSYSTKWEMRNHRALPCPPASSRIRR